MNGSNLLSQELGSKLSFQYLDVRTVENML